jgi:DNA-damage-inducible protein J
MAVKTAEIRLKIEPNLKKESKKIFKKLGLNESEGVRLLLKGLVLHRGIPFEFKIPVVSDEEQQDIESILSSRTENDREIVRNDSISLEL